MTALDCRSIAQILCAHFLKRGHLKTKFLHCFIDGLLPKGVLGQYRTPNGFPKAKRVQCLKRQNLAEPGLSLLCVTGMRMKSTNALLLRTSLWYSRRWAGWQGIGASGPLAAMVLGLLGTKTFALLSPLPPGCGCCIHGPNGSAWQSGHLDRGARLPESSLWNGEMVNGQE